MSDKKQVEWCEDAKIGRQEVFAGDRSTLETGEADQYIKLGWCKCVATGEQGERKAGHAKLYVKDTYMAVK